jgi:hypothetical protein
MQDDGERHESRPTVVGAVVQRRIQDAAIPVVGEGDPDPRHVIQLVSIVHVRYGQVQPRDQHDGGDEKEPRRQQPDTG